MTKETVSYIQTLKPTIWVGKNGCSEDLVEEIRSQLKRRQVIKVKWLSGADMCDEEVAYLAKTVNADILDSRGKIVVFGAKNRAKSSSGANDATRAKDDNNTARAKNKRAYLVGRK